MKSKSFLACFLVLASSVSAQTPPPATPAPAAAPVSQAAVTPSTRAAIKELLDLTRTRENLARAYQTIGQQLPSQFAQVMNMKIEQSGITPEQKQKVRESMNVPFENAVKEANGVLSDPKLLDAAMERLYPIYASHFTEAEVKQLVAFYKSPVGAKTLAEMPKVLNETMQGGVGMFQPKLNAIVDNTVKKQIEAVTTAKK